MESGEYKLNKKPSKRLADILDEEYSGYKNNVVWDKFLKLKALWESKNRDASIDNQEIRWITDRLEDLDNGKTLTKNDLLSANLYWKKYK